MTDALVTQDARTMNFDVSISAADTLNIYGEYIANIERL